MKTKLLSIILLFISLAYSQTTHIVEASNMQYTPSDLIIQEGDIVIWLNTEGFHDVNFEINSITNEDFNNPESFSFAPVNGDNNNPLEIGTWTFNLVGTYSYDCSIGQHASMGMIGTIIVEPSGTSSMLDELNFKNEKYLYSIDTNGQLVRKESNNKIVLDIYEQDVIKKYIIK